MNKSYIAAILIAAATAARALGWIDQETYAILLGALNAGGLAALRAGVAKIERK